MKKERFAIYMAQKTFSVCVKSGFSLDGDGVERYFIKEVKTKEEAEDFCLRPSDVEHVGPYTVVTEYCAEVEEWRDDLSEWVYKDSIAHTYVRQRDLMRWGEALSWCMPYEYETYKCEKVAFCVCDGEIIPHGMTKQELLDAVGDEYGEGWTKEEHVMNECFSINAGCIGCPFFDDCDAMDERI